MNLEEKISKGCQNKKAYPTKKLAKRSARLLKLKTYRCIFCEAYHLTRDKGPRYRDVTLDAIRYNLGR